MSGEKGSVPSLDEKRGSIASDNVDFGGESSLPPPPTLTAEEERKLWRKVDLRLMPILSLMYLLSFMDRGNAKLQGLVTQLDLTGNRYNIALLFSRIVYLNAQQISFSSDSTPHGKNSYPQLVGVRVCLGVTEAGLFPGVVYYLSLWYPRHKLQVRIGLFFGAASLAGAFSGLLAFGISFMSGTRGLLGWSWIFILEGIATVVVGILAAFSECRLRYHTTRGSHYSTVLVDFPSTATFLTPEERSYIVHKKKYDNSSVGEEEHFEMRHLWAAVTDWQVRWDYSSKSRPDLHPGLATHLNLHVHYRTSTIINSFGHTPAISQLLTVPPYVVATTVLYIFAYYSDKIKMRSPFIVLGLVFCLIGFSINISEVSNGVKYFGTFFVVTGSYAAFPGIVAWLGNNLAGQYKRGIGMAMHIGIGNFSGAIASNIYRSKDSPRFLVGHGCELMFVGIGFVTVPIAVLAYIHINRKRDAAEREALERGESNKYTPQQLREMGDRAPDFRYTL
ncbi:hypothetical protein CVT26_009588 [Gymnopilus dilepis]|uniref:Major facilitator superfamily (MFS) profile domain-containing protein n=1 Tax=Gymnopilus dilepis TaxID=231916 RepID=A0A409YII1_9AGAR|nr:hypothetical protein CVT26_009588 [Gymnopilus dilepis]